VCWCVLAVHSALDILEVEQTAASAQAAPLHTAAPPHTAPSMLGRHCRCCHCQRCHRRLCTGATNTSPPPPPLLAPPSPPPPPPRLRLLPPLPPLLPDLQGGRAAAHVLPAHPQTRGAPPGAGARCHLRLAQDIPGHRQRAPRAAHQGERLRVRRAPRLRQSSCRCCVCRRCRCGGCRLMWLPGAAAANAAVCGCRCYCRRYCCRRCCRRRCWDCCRCR
jgi:hypothetical protein